MCNGYNHKCVLNPAISNLALALNAFILSPIAVVGIVVVFIAQPQVCFSRRLSEN